MKDPCKKCGICCRWGIIIYGKYIRTEDKCRYLGEDNLCVIYKTRKKWRPKWCRTVEESKLFDEFKYYPETCGYKCKKK